MMLEGQDLLLLLNSPGDQGRRRNSKAANQVAMKCGEGSLH
jgi:hypothetical protein